jgi:sugar phosphate isomerase/epimerase
MMKYSVTTVLLPEYSLEEAAELLSRVGYDGVEWRVRRIPAEQRDKPYSMWGNHKNDLTPDVLAKEGERVRRVSADHGLAISALASNASCTDLNEVKLLAEGAAACGARCCARRTTEGRPACCTRSGTACRRSSPAEPG